MTVTLEDSYRLCSQAARRASSSFAAWFWLLPREQRRAMQALYAFARRCDDLADSTAPADQRRRDLAAWREAVESALAGDVSADPLLPALADVQRRFTIAPRHFRDLLAGVERDLDPPTYETWDELAEYCRLVASSVGLMCLAVWGASGAEAERLATVSGQALQLTNILRDVGEDADRGRLYLPLEDLTRFSVAPAELLVASAPPGERFAALVRFEVERAERLYAEAAPLAGHLPPPGRRVWSLMTAGYVRLLEKLRRAGPDVLVRRVRLSWADKALLAVRHACGQAPGAGDRRAVPPSASR